MGCCGRSVPPSGASNSSGRPRSAQPAHAAEPRRYSHVFFEYTGASALTAVGGVTRKQYRFDRPGARVAVDPTDRDSLARVPNLRIVMGP
jgi:hypothetical protein